MIYAIHEAESGRLVSTTTDPAKVAAPAVLAARGYAVAERPDSEAGGVWNAVTLQFDPPPPPEREITAYDFLRRFTTAEMAAILASPDPVVKVFHTLLQTAAASGVLVDLDGAVTMQGVGYLAANDYLSEARAAEVLA
jgi:hypothetical protein